MAQQFKLILPNKIRKKIYSTITYDTGNCNVVILISLIIIKPFLKKIFKIVGMIFNTTIKKNKNIINVAINNLSKLKINDYINIKRVKRERNKLSNKDLLIFLLFILVKLIFFRKFRWHENKQQFPKTYLDHSEIAGSRYWVRKLSICFVACLIPWVAKWEAMPKLVSRL